MNKHTLSWTSLRHFLWSYLPEPSGLSACSGSLDCSFLGSASCSWTSFLDDGISGSSEITDSSTFSTVSDLKHNLQHGKLSSIRYIPVNRMKYQQNVPDYRPRDVITGNSVGKRDRGRLSLTDPERRSVEKGMKGAEWTLEPWTDSIGN